MMSVYYLFGLRAVMVALVVEREWVRRLGRPVAVLLTLLLPALALTSTALDPVPSRSTFLICGIYFTVMTWRCLRAEYWR